MQRLPILLLYGLDEHSHPFEVDSTLELIDHVSWALTERDWRVERVELRHDIASALEPYAPADWLVLNLCEGSPHQAFYYAKVALELGKRGYTFTGSDYFSLDQTQFKWVMKHLFEEHHVPTARWTVVDDADKLEFDAFPAIIKPAAEHCSYGISRDSVVLNLEEARRQARRIIEEFSAPALVEQFLDSAEYNISLWGDHEPEVLGISTMTYDMFSDIHDRLCTFDAKWTPGSEAYRKIPATCPAPVSAELKAQLEGVALMAYRASGVRDYGRVDIRLHHGHPMVLDVNSNCDVSMDGGFFNAARAAGYSYGEMLERIVLFAAARALLPVQQEGPRERVLAGR